MFKIYDGREKFYQWDLDRKLIVEDASVTEVHFCNRTDSCSLVCETYVEDGVTLVNVPNVLLTTDWKIHVYAYDGKHTKHDECYEVISRTKPSDYIYTETEVKRYEDYENRIKALEENGGGVGAATADNGEIFNDYTNNKALSKYSSARGENTIAGVRGYWYSKVEISPINKSKITLTTVHNDTQETVWNSTDVCEYEPGDIISIIADNKYYNCATIESVNGNVIFLKEDLYDILDGKQSFKYKDGFDDNIIYVVAKPHIGYVDLGIAATAEGGSFKTTEVTGALAPYSHVEGRNNQAVGHYSHAEGRNNQALNVCAHIEGQNNVASGLMSHAEGSYTEAIGDYSHAEGNNTTASGIYSHAEGSNTTAEGKSAHAEGSHTEASGFASHAEGDDTVASSLQSHAEGYKTVSKGGASHSEGAGTIASGYAQHVQGRYNIEDTAKKYAHIVGNGKDDANRSNAHTLDWDGNAWFKGGIETTNIILKSLNGHKFRLMISDVGGIIIQKAE